MRAPPFLLLTEPVATTLIPEPVAALVLINLAAVDAALLARMLLQPQPPVLLDCGLQPYRRSLGVCYFLSQLLLVRQRGATVWLCNVNASLRRCLQQLGLHSTFFLAE